MSHMRSQGFIGCRHGGDILNQVRVFVWCGYLNVLYRLLV